MDANQKTKQKLERFPRRTIQEKELFDLLGCTSYEAYFKSVKSLIEKQWISSISASGMNGRIPALHNRYRINKSEPYQAEELRSEVKTLHPSLSINAYLQDLDKFYKHRDIIIPLNRYIWEHGLDLDQSMSLNERSFEIFGNEKLLARERHLVESVLTYNDLTWDFLNCYITPEPFFSWHLGGSKQVAGSVLILENKDIWYTLLRLSEELGLNSLFEERITLLVYGEGNKITRTENGLDEFLERFFGTPFERVYYAGDLDLEGINIYRRLKEAQHLLSIRPFLPIYQEMLKWAMRCKHIEGFNLSCSPDTRHKEADVESFLLECGCALLYNQVEIRMLATAIKDGGMIPQETVNRPILIKLLKKEA